MDAASLSRRTILFVNIAHAFDHFVLLIYPTAVIAIAAERMKSNASVDLPTPDSPSKATSSPRAIASETPLKTKASP